MPFESISREQFEAFQPPSWVLNRLTLEQVEWFANAVANIIGTIAGKEGDCWSYVVLKGVRNGNYRVCTQTSLADRLDISLIVSTGPTGKSLAIDTYSPIR